MKNTDNLLELVIKAHGGAERWNQLNQLTVHLSTGGYLWKVKGNQDVLKDFSMNVKLHFQESVISSLFTEQLRANFSPFKVTLTKQTGENVEELENPKQLFLGQSWETKWTDLQFVYFATYASYTYFTTPFNFTLPGVVTNEIESWAEAGEIWRRLEVIYPDSFVTHSKRQIYYFDEKGFLKRHDYWAETLGGSGAARYAFDYIEKDGLRMPTRHHIYSIDNKGHYNLEPLLVSISVLEAQFD